MNEVAKTILAQLGGANFLLLTGAKNLTYSENSFSCKIMKNSKKVSHVKVVLNAMDTYDVTFYYFWGTKALKNVTS